MFLMTHRASKTAKPRRALCCRRPSELVPNDRYDVVAAFYVFVHFVDDAKWLSFLQRALSWVAPRGVLLLADQFTEARTMHGKHVVVRPRADYEAAFAASGFHIDDCFHAKLSGDIESVVPGANAFLVARRYG